MSEKLSLNAKEILKYKNYCIQKQHNANLISLAVILAASFGLCIIIHVDCVSVITIQSL